MAGSGDLDPGGGAAAAACGGGQHREPKDLSARLRSTVCCGAFRRTSVEGDRRGSDHDRESHRGRMRGADPDGEGAAGRRGGVHPDREAAVEQGAGQGRRHRHREDGVLAQSQHEVLEETQVPAQEDHHPAPDGAEDQQHQSGPPANMTEGQLSPWKGTLVLLTVHCCK